MYNLVIADSAEYDLEKIISYFTDTLIAPVAASRFLDAVYECYDNLENFPFMYEQCRNPKLKNAGYRRAIIDSYVLIYEVQEENKSVVVHHFFYGRQEYSKLI